MTTIDTRTYNINMSVVSVSNATRTINANANANVNVNANTGIDNTMWNHIAIPVPLACIRIGPQTTNK